MNYTEAIAYLEEVASFGIHPGLERITALLEELGNPQHTYKTIHVTGTNGKGSVSTYITYGLYMSGLRVGTFTSPHLQSYTERMRVNTACITEEAFGDLIERVSHAVTAVIERGVEAPTQFEILTAAAFLFFQEQGVDYAVIEVGLGGLLDSTNVITPEVAVITNVTIDHQAYCGDTVEEIARHKAGIIKQGVPLVTAAQGSALDVIKETAKSLGVKYHVFNEDFTIDSRSAMAMGQMITVKDKEGHKDMLFTSMHGIHQTLNLACAARVLQILKDKEPAVSEETYREGLARATWPGRFETFKVHGRTIIIDGAHNASGAEAFSMTFNELYPDKAKTVVLSILEDKDVSTMVSYLVGQKDHVITVPAPTPRGIAPEQLAKQMPVQADPMETIQEGLDHAMKITKEGDIIAVVGSLYILGDVQQWLAQEMGH